MSRPTRRGKLRNPPKAKRYAMIGVVIAMILGAAVGVYYYTGGDPGKLVSFGGTTSSSTTTTSSGSFATSTSIGSSSVVYAVLETSQGQIEVELYPASAPKTVQNFVNLANSGFYNDLVWHRIVKDFAVQTGDPNTRNGGGNQATWGQGGSDQTVPLEASLNNDQWTLGMARSSDPNSGSSQFFINLKSNPSLNGQYTVFGKVIKGTEVVQALANLPVSSTCASSGGLTCTPVDPQQAMLKGVKIQSAP